MIKDQNEQNALRARQTIREDIKRRKDMVEAALAMKNEEHEQRKEIAMLRKLD